MTTVAVLPSPAVPVVDKPGIRLDTERALLIALVVICAARLVAMALVPLAPEEAYYWMYWQNPNLSYYDHPPMIAWLIGAGVTIFGHSEFGVRAGGMTLMFLLSAMMCRFGEQWFSKRAGLLAAVLLQILPMYFISGFIATMDAPLMFFWMLCLVGVSDALKGGRTTAWYVAGVGLGGALLSKYTGVFLALGTFAALIAYRPWRKHLASVHVWLALLLALAMFSPVVIWNARHDWASFRFQFLDRFSESQLNLWHIFIFVAYQIATVTPFVLIACVALLVRMCRSKRRLLTPRWIIAAVFSIPLLLVMAQKSVTYGIHINWTLPAFLSLFPAFCHYMLVARRHVKLVTPTMTALLWWTIPVCIGIDFLLCVYFVVLQPRVGWVSAMGPWQQLAQIVEEYENRVEAETGREPLIIADGKYRLASVLAFYRTGIEGNSDPSRYTTSEWLVGGKGLGYEYWSTAAQWEGRDCILVDDDPSIEPEARKFFTRVDQVPDPRLTHLFRHPFAIAIGHKYKPKPPSNSRPLLRER